MEPRRLRMLWVGAALIAGIHASSCRRDAPPPNIILISVDALRADHVGAYGYGRSTTPFIDSLAKTGRVFLNGYVPLPATAPSHASLLTSLHPLQHRVLSNAVTLPNDLETVAEALKARGYFTMGAIAVSHMKRHYQFHQGFDIYSDDWDPNDARNGIYHRAAPVVNESVYAMVDAYLRQGAASPFFLFVHYFDVHVPYQDHDPREAHSRPESRQSGGDQADAIRRYDSEVRFVDEHIRRVYDYLNARGLTKNTKIVVTADHGEQLGEHGHREGHVDLYRETIRVPLILSGSDVAPREIDRLVSTMDIGVALLSLAGGGYSEAVSGTNLPGNEEGRTAAGRQLLVLGYPSYTRSLALVSQDQVFIRNLDRYYRRLAFRRPGEGERDRIHRQWQTARPSLEEDGAVRHSLPLLASINTMKPGYVAAHVTLSPRNCRASLALHVEPRLDYLAEPVKFRGALRLHVPTVPLRDDVALTVSKCAANVQYQLRPFESMAPLHERLPSGYDVVDTAVWANLLTARKERNTDELYDLETDPQMDHNLIGQRELEERARESADAIGRRWLDLSGTSHERGGAPAYTSDDLEMLRSLGYVH